MTYELVLGLEIHMQLNTKQKMFCACKNDPFHGKVNTHACPVCLGLPGAMPVVNKEAIDRAQIMAHALGSKLREEIIFERKNYFYPDLPKAFQLTTPHYPISEGGEYKMLFPVVRHSRRPKGVESRTGSFATAQDDRVAWREIHIEEDTAKSMHKNGKTWIDYNKSGVPLLEMVTEPTFKTIDEAVQFAKEIQMVARYVGASEADMEKGHMRLEANISLRKMGEKELPNYRVEIKNINSFTFMKKALEAEIKRQTQALDHDEKLIQETRGYNEDKKETFSQRGKEDAHDYRYFPEPDIPPVKLRITNYELRIKTPRDMYDLLKKENVRENYLPVIVAHKDLADFALETIKIGKKEGIDADVVAGEIVNKKIDLTQITPEKLVADLKKSKSDVVSDEGELTKWIDQAIAENEKVAQDVRNGKLAAIGALIGAVMRYSKGKADAKKINELLVKKLS